MDEVDIIKDSVVASILNGIKRNIIDFSTIYSCQELNVNQLLDPCSAESEDITVVLTNRMLFDFHNEKRHLLTQKV